MKKKTILLISILLGAIFASYYTYLKFFVVWTKQVQIDLNLSICVTLTCIVTGLIIALTMKK